jgi:hypothetical protein
MLPLHYGYAVVKAENFELQKMGRMTERVSFVGVEAASLVSCPFDCETVAAGSCECSMMSGSSLSLIGDLGVVHSPSPTRDSTCADLSFPKKVLNANLVLAHILVNVVVDGFDDSAFCYKVLEWTDLLGSIIIANACLLIFKTNFGLNPVLNFL